MSTAETAHVREREALGRLLASGAFSRAPNLEKILVYLCEKHFAGDSQQVKEFHLATEVLGRPGSFDPKKDSIVRVELHRLRKRLKDYYEKTPAEPIRILLPEKTYAPEFQVLLPRSAPALTLLPKVPPPPPASPFSARTLAMAAGAVAAVLVLAWLVLRQPPARERYAGRRQHGPRPGPAADRT